LRVLANGDEVELPEEATLTDLLDVLDLGPKWVVAEVNGDPVARADMPSTRLADGDRIELVRAVAGG
jgi:sulfur carrier protein